MPVHSPIYSELNRKWKATCKIIFGEEIGELEDYKEYLTQLGYSEPLLHRNSSISGKELTYATSDYCQSAKWIGLSEIDFQKKFEPLSINEVKDIDSIVQAVQERIHYSGDAILGNSKFIERSSNVTDSFYIYESGMCSESKYVAYSDWPKMSQNIFGSTAAGESEFCIRCNDTYRDKRCFELWGSLNCSDCYYVSGLNGCSNCFFCFSGRGLKNAIGNLQLPQEKFAALKAKLLEEIRETLKKEKSLPSLVQIMGRCKDHSGEVKQLLKGKIQYEEKKTDFAPLENSFSKTSEILLGKPLHGLSSYSSWLSSHSKRLKSVPSVASGKPVYVGGYAHYFDLPEERMLTEQEALLLAKLSRLSEKEANSLSIKNAHELLGKTAYISLDYHDGANINVNESPTYGYSSHAFRTFPVVYSKYSAYTFWLRSSEHVFGGAIVFDSNFCLNCYNSVKLQRCLEVDSSRNCSDSYFLHNCENVHDSMFCFNAKNLTNAIGNAELGKKEYAGIKKAVLEQVHSELEKKKSLKWDIYTLGCSNR